jgi:hypothetical protein
MSDVVTPLQGEGAAGGIGSAYFYNMTNQTATVIVNNFFANSVQVTAMPTSTPYTPNVSTGFTRYQGSAQGGQFGTSNQVVYQLSGQTTGQKTMTVNIDWAAYPIQFDILIYLFYNSIVVAVSSDNNAYLGSNGATISVNPGNSEQQI